MTAIAAWWQGIVAWIGDGTGLPDAMLHVHAGMAVLLIARLASGRSLGTFVPLGAVMLAEAANELLDRITYHSWRWPDTLADIANTLFWPAVICLAVRLRPMALIDRRPASLKRLVARRKHRRHEVGLSSRR